MTAARSNALATALSIAALLAISIWLGACIVGPAVELLGN